MNKLVYVFGIALFAIVNSGCSGEGGGTVPTGWGTSGASGTGGGANGASTSTAAIAALTDYIDDPDLVSDEFERYDASDNLEKVMAIGGVNPFATNDDGNWELFVINGDGSNFTQLTDSTYGDVRFGRITANGSKIIFTANNNLTGDNGVCCATSLYEINTNGTGLRQLSPATDSGSLGRYFGMNSTGTKVVFEAARDYSAAGYPWGNTLHLLDVTSGTITALHSGETYNAPVMSADGTTVAFASTGDLTGGNADGSMEIFAINTASSSVTQVTDYIAMSVPEYVSGDGYNLHISSDGRFVVFLSSYDLTGSKTGTSKGLYRVDVGTGATYLLSDPDSDGVSRSLSLIQAITSDDRKVIYYNDGLIYEVTADGTNRVVRSAYADRYPTPNRDGSRIVIESSRISLPETTEYGASQLYIIQ